MRPHEYLTEHYADEEGKRRYLVELFNRGARHYNWIDRIGSFGTGHAYRRRALQLGGLKPGMRVLDVACGTGAVTRAILDILGEPAAVCAVDPSEGMLAEARKSLPAQFQVGWAEALPYADEQFDFLTMGYALRHVSDFRSAFAEFSRVLKPGGQLLLLEISRPRQGLSLLAARCYMGRVLPWMTRVFTGSADAARMTEYYWETIDACASPEQILEALRASGFQEAERRVEMGIFSAYRACKRSA